MMRKFCSNCANLIIGFTCGKGRPINHYGIPDDCPDWEPAFEIEE